MSKFTERRPIADASINVTSLIDVTMTVLIIFILLAPIMEQGIDVKLPKAKAELVDQENKFVTISLQEFNDGSEKYGVIFFNQNELDRLNPFTVLTDELEKVHQENPQTTIIIRADKAFKTGIITKLMKIIGDVGFEQITLATQME